MISVIIWLSLVIFLFIGLPIGIAIGGLSSLMLLVDGTVTPLAIVQSMVNSVDSFPLMAVPFFILAGDIMNRSGVTDRIFNFANNLVGHVPGGLGQVNILSSVILAGMSGSVVSDICGLGKIEMKAMNDAGYDKEFSAAVTVSSAIIGPIIPPSIPLVIYGSIAGVSVMKLLAGGLIPGLILAFALTIVVGIIAKRRKYPRKPVPTFAIVWGSFKDSIGALLMPVILLGGVLGGIVTPTEGAALSCIYAIILGKFVYRTLSWKDLWDIFKSSSAFVGTTLFIIAASGVLGKVLTQQNVPQKMLYFFASITSNKIILLMMLNVLLIILGCLMESAAIIVVLAPLLAQLAVSYGLDPIAFGVMVVFNLMISNLTPPVGMGLFLGSKIGEVKFADLFKEVRPFLFAMFICLIIITYVPDVVLFLPRMM